MTAWGTVDLAVEAMRHGARDFVQKPWDNARLLTTLRTQIALGRALRLGQRLEAENRILRYEGFPADDRGIPRDAARPRRHRAGRPVGRQRARSPARTATGKTLVARALHAASSRAARPFLTLNAGGISEGVFESELFGHVKGAFTDARADRVGRFELADGGTLFLDEIGNVPLSQQGKLLRVLETGEFERVGSSRTRRCDVRILSATNANLAAEVAAGRFRQDLLFRLNTIEIHVPSLAERRRRHPAPRAAVPAEPRASATARTVTGFEPAAMEALLAHSLAGQRARARPRDRARRPDVGRRSDPRRRPGTRSAAATRTRLEDLSLEEVESLLVRKAMDRFGGNVSQAAKALGVSRSALYRRLEKHGQ